MLLKNLDLLKFRYVEKSFGGSYIFPICFKVKLSATKENKNQSGKGLTKDIIESLVELLRKNYNGFDLFPDPEKTYLDDNVVMNESGNIACFIVRTEVRSLVLMEGTLIRVYKRIYWVKDNGDGTLSGHIVDSETAISGVRESDYIGYELSEIKNNILHYIVKERSRKAEFAGIGFVYGGYDGGIWEIKKSYNLE